MCTGLRSELYHNRKSNTLWAQSGAVFAIIYEGTSNSGRPRQEGGMSHAAAEVANGHGGWQHDIIMQVSDFRISRTQML